MEIKLKGQRVDNGEMVYGNLVKCPYLGTYGNEHTADIRCYIFSTESWDSYEIIPESEQLFSGEQDNHGNDIYFGDKYTWTAFGAYGGENEERTEHLKDFTDIEHLRIKLLLNKTVTVIDPNKGDE